MKFYIFAARDLHDERPHIFYSDDFSKADEGTQYEVLKSFFVDYLTPEDKNYYDAFVQKVDGRDSIVIPKGDTITITEIGADGSFCFDDDGLEFCIPREIDTPMYLRCLDSSLVACDVMGVSCGPDGCCDDGGECYEDDYDQHSEEWYIARDHGLDTDPYI